MLLGYETAAGDLVIATATLPGPAASQGWKSFVPDHAWDEQQLVDHYRASSRLLRYQGEWHSHPFGVLQPSKVDIATMARIARFPGAMLPAPISAIVSRSVTRSLVWSVFCVSATGVPDGVSAKVIDSQHTHEALGGRG